MDQRNIDFTDRISKLPKRILRHILFFMPAEDAARTAILSKTWKTTWNSLPRLDFCFEESEYKNRVFNAAKTEDLMNRFKEDLRHLEPKVDSDAWTTHGLDFDFDADDFTKGMQTESFMNWVDKSLSILGNKKVTIDSLKFHMKMSRDSFACRMDKWIGLATRNNIRELEIIFIRELENILRGTETNGLRYSLPDTMYVAKSLLSLTLWNCALRKPLLCSCLQNLNLENVSLCHDNIIQNILLNSPLLERFILGGCSGVNNIRLCNLPRLVSVSTRGVSKVKIEAPNLQSLCYSWNDGPSGLEVIACNKLKKLHISALMTSQSVQELISRFPFLETLYLSLGGLSRLKTCNTQLKHLNLQSDFEELEIDTANLSSYIYGGQAIPSHVSLKNSSLQDVSITLNLYSFDTQWFFKLRKHLANFKQIDCLRLNVCADMTSPSTQGSLNLLQLSHEGIPPPSKLKYLNIVFCRTSRVHCIALIDGLLWSSRPNKLSIISIPGQPGDEFFKILYMMLANREENPLCCSESHVRCWRHYLKGFEYQKFVRKFDEQSRTYSASFESSLFPKLPDELILWWE